MIERIVSGGQTGSDQAALRAAKRFGIPTAGTAPLGWLTEDGPAPWLADFGLVECQSPGYPARTRRNVSNSEATVFFGNPRSAGYGATMWACVDFRKPAFHIPWSPLSEPRLLAGTLRMPGVRVENCAGNRESRSPGIGEWVEQYLCNVFRAMGFKETGGGVAWH